MKKLLLIAVISAATGVSLFAGTSGKEIIQQAPPPCEWYRAHEWDLDLWGTFAFTFNDGTNDDGRFLEPSEGHVPEGSGFPSGSRDPQEHTAVGRFHNDRFLDRDNTWGGGADVKYFFSKYWALGGEGLVVDSKRNIGGGGFGTFTFRYPIACSRFAPYAWAGLGVMAGGEHSEWFFNEIHRRRGSAIGPVVVETESHHNNSGGIQNKHAEVSGQFGTGLEYRITPRIGIMGDFAWNLISGPDNNFGMARFGLTLSY